ncbi:MAG: hypothetical protein PHU78_03530 [Heliobacteriaceae bacterium]|nr:hypothetical protein [Heliobacteriaceae bacterium]
MFLGNLIEGKLALGLLEVTVYKHPEDGKIIADELRSYGYSVTTEIGYGIEGKSRLVMNIIVSRKDFPALKHVLANHGQVNMVVKPVAKVSGKVGAKKIPAVNSTAKTFCRTARSQGASVRKPLRSDNVIPQIF